ncbi:MAG: cation:proton antiporter [Phycisphaerae bacterium]|nr:cation:proton antiporter [Phycisphaerae bacterium]
MTVPLALSVGVLFAAGTFMLMRRSFVKIVVGLALLGHAGNLLIFTAGSPVKGRPPLISGGSDTLSGAYTDPIPPALILTAIVIGFGIVSYTIVLIKRTYRDLGTDDVREMMATER